MSKSKGGSDNIKNLQPLHWKGKHAPNTINQSLNKIKAFLNYCVDKHWMGQYKSISSTLKPKPISYFTDDEFKAVIEALPTKELRRAMLFYRETGCRKREPFISKRVGNTLIIPPMKSNPIERRIVLSDVLCRILMKWLLDSKSVCNTARMKDRLGIGIIIN